MSLTQGNTIIYVGNFEDGEIKAFHRRYQPGNPSYGEPTIISYNATSVSGAVNSSFAAARRERTIITEFFDLYMDIPQSVISSPYELVNNGDKQRELALYYEENQSLQQVYSNYLNFIAQIVANIHNADINMYVTAKLHNESSVDFRLAGLDPSGKIEFEVYRAYDELGNPVPLSASEFEGTFRFNDRVFTRFVRAAQAFRIEVSSPQGIPTTSIRDCKNVTIGNEQSLVCSLP